MEVRYPSPLKRGISAILARYLLKTRQMGAIPPSAILSRKKKGIARYAGVSRTGPLRLSSAPYCRTAQSSERRNFRMDFSIKFGKEIPS